MNFAKLFAETDALKAVVELELGHELTGEETVKIEIPFKKTIKVVRRFFRTETVTEIAIVRELEVDRICYDAKTKTVIIKGK